MKHRGEDPYRHVVGQIATYAIFTFGADGRITSWNPGVEQLLGYREDEFVGRPGSIIFTAEDRASGVPEQEMSEAAETGEAMDDRWHVRKDGSRLWANGVMTALRDGDGRLTGFVKIMRDSTERKRAQEELQEAHDRLEQRVEERTRQLRESEERFAAAFHYSPTPGYIVRAPEMRFTDVNESYEKLTGYARDELLGRTGVEIGLFVDLEERARALELFRESGEVSIEELRIRTRSGGIRYVSAAGRAITVGGTPFALGSMVDITQNKRTEQDLVRALQEVLQNTSWLAQSVMEKLTHARVDGGGEVVELADLTNRERQVLELLAKGMSNHQIAAELDLTVQTVRNYMTSIYGKLDVHSRAEAVVWARERGLGG